MSDTDARIFLVFAFIVTCILVSLLVKAARQARKDGPVDFLIMGGTAVLATVLAVSVAVEFVKT